ncbi:MAG: hypothetical protein WAL25_12295 [Acidimicrobiia bacterium]
MGRGKKLVSKFEDRAEKRAVYERWRRFSAVDFAVLGVAIWAMIVELGF